MSQWTYVNAIFRLEGHFKKISNEELVDIFGKSVDAYDVDKLEYNEDWELKNKEKYLPVGTEGSLKMKIWRESNLTSMSATTVSIFGDLRDFYNLKEIEEWFNRCCDKLPLRQAVCQVDNGRHEKIFYRSHLTEGNL